MGACEIFKVLGTPTCDELRAMNPNYPRDYNFRPAVPKLRWPDVLKNKAKEDGCDLVDQLVRYDPSMRMSPAQCMLHRFFDSLRAKEDPSIKVPLFDLMEDEIWFCTAPEREKLVPKWYSDKRLEREKEKLKQET